jgi:hypothetical protein
VGLRIENVGIFMPLCNILRPFGIFCHFGSFMVIWYIFPLFGILCQEKSGNPAVAQPKIGSNDTIRTASSLSCTTKIGLYIHTYIRHNCVISCKQAFNNNFQFYCRTTSYDKIRINPNWWYRMTSHDKKIVFRVNRLLKA